MKKLLLFLLAFMLFSCEMSVDEDDIVNNENLEEDFTGNGSYEPVTKNPMYYIEDEAQLSQLRAVEYNSTGNLANLTALRCDVPSSVDTGGSLNVYLELENSGLAASGVTVSLYLSENATISTGDIHLSDILIGDMVSGAKHSQTTAIVIPKILDNLLIKGDYFIGYIIDKDNVIAEAREYDNILDRSHVQSVVIGESDIVQEVSTENGVTTVTFQNIGTSNSEAFNYSFVVSTWTNLTHSNTNITRPDNPIYVGVEGVTDINSFTCPGLRPGMKYSIKYTIIDEFYEWDITTSNYIPFDANLFKNSLGSHYRLYLLNSKYGVDTTGRYIRISSL